MAARTIAENARVVESGRHPRTGVMAHLAGLGGRNVVDGFARCLRAVMTALAVTGDPRVVEPGRQPGLRRVAGGACRRCRNVIGRLSGSRHTVVASLAQTAHFAVIHGDDGNPCRGGVARIAGIGGGNMIRRFARGGGAVVAGHARHRADRAVIETRGHPGDGDMAGIAFRPRRYVIGRLAARLQAVVTTAARCRHRAVIKYANAGPRD